MKLIEQKNDTLISWVLQISGLIGMSNVNTDIFSNRLEEMLPIIQQINEQFKDPVKDTFKKLKVYPESHKIFFRTERHLCAFASLNSCRCMKLND